MPDGGVIAGSLITGGIGVATLIISKIKGFYKQNGSLSYGCGFTEKHLIDNDEIEVHLLECNNVDVIYIGKKRKYVEESSDSSDSCETDLKKKLMVLRIIER